ncbi:zinc ribbon domain-containing protein [Metabacillus sp. KIGAM252]|uniref:Zinc ribbon domain-containing protein n=1 Tax=Metabacillus flavus TaxID=2823519 RepID=A0ABS5LJ03_9BACI|nr:zinc ribbon domain-containing protein [Metabacillus flavus]MBS2970727.1 zinc ribbon domain-containing protein [Metabacillus flavus]
MSDLQSTLGSGLNKIQDSLQQGKQKIQTAQEVSQYKKALYEAGTERGELLLKLAETVYQMVRSGTLQHEEFDKYQQPISELDQKMFQAQQAIALLNAKSLEQHACSGCGTVVTDQDKFCGSCGARVEIPEKKPAQEMKACRTCDEMIPEEARFCTCCGIHLAG